MIKKEKNFLKMSKKLHLIFNVVIIFFLNLPIRRLKRGVFHMCGIYNINYRRYFAVPFVSDKKREEFLKDVKKTALNV